MISIAVGHAPIPHQHLHEIFLFQMVHHPIKPFPLQYHPLYNKASIRPKRRLVFCLMNDRTDWNGIAAHNGRALASIEVAPKISLPLRLNREALETSLAPHRHTTISNSCRNQGMNPHLGSDGSVVGVGALVALVLDPQTHSRDETRLHQALVYLGMTTASQGGTETLILRGEGVPIWVHHHYLHTRRAASQEMVGAKCHLIFHKYLPLCRPNVYPLAIRGVNPTRNLASPMFLTQRVYLHNPLRCRIHLPPGYHLQSR